LKNWKTWLLVLVTVALLLLCAALPVIAASIQDSATVDQYGYSDMESLELDFTTSMSLLGKLALIRDGTYYAVSPTETVIRQSGIEQVVKNGLNLYYEASLVPYNWKNYEFTAQPHLVNSPADMDGYAIIWVVSIYWPDMDSVLELYVDDETGLILYLHYNAGQPLDVYTTRGYLDALSNAYLESTGLAAVLEDPEAFGVEFVTFDDSGLYAKGDKSYTHTIYHPDYGSIVVAFWVYQNGYYTIIRKA